MFRPLIPVLLATFAASAWAQSTPAVPPTSAAAPSPTTAKWSRDSYIVAMKASGRPHDINAGTFDTIQKRKDTALAQIDRYLAQRFGKADPAVLKAFAELPREYFHYQYAEKRAMAADAYEGEAKPWAIGYGSALSDYLGQAYMTQAAQPKSTDVVLEIGTGSGFQSSLLSRIVKSVYSIEIIEPLGKAVADVYKPIGITNVSTRVGDGFFGWPEEKDGFDLIMVTCVAQYVPPPLLKQLKPGGRLVIPIGQPFKREQFLYVFSKDADGKVHSKKDLGVYFIPMTGAMQKEPPPPPPEPAAAKPADAPKK